LKQGVSTGTLGDVFSNPGLECDGFAESSRCGIGYDWWLSNRNN